MKLIKILLFIFILNFPHTTIGQEFPPELLAYPMTNNARVSLRIIGESGYKYRVEKSPDFSVWAPVTDLDYPRGINRLIANLETHKESRMFFRLISLGKMVTPPVVPTNTPPTYTQGRLIVDLDTSSPSARMVGGLNDTVMVLRFRAIGEPIDLRNIGLRLVQGDTRSVKKLTVWSDATKIGESVFVGPFPYAGGALTPSVVIQPDQEKLITIKADYQPLGLSQIGTPGDTILLENIKSTTFGVGQIFGGFVDAEGVAVSAPGRLHRSVPIVRHTPITTRLSSGRQDLLRFSITASPPGDIQFARSSITVATSGNVEIRNLNMYAFTDPYFQIPVPKYRQDGSVLRENDQMVISSETPQLVRFPVENNQGIREFLTIPSGSVHFFTVRGDVVTDGIVSTLTTVLLGDSTYPQGSSPSGTLGTMAEINGNNFIWSPMSQGFTTEPWDLDWANGQWVPGLPAHGFQQILTP